MDIQLPNILPLTNIAQLLSILVNLAYFVAGLAFFINLIIGGIQWISSGGDPKSLQSARGRITSAFIGLIIVVAAYAITLIAGQVFGIDIFNFKFK